jgi:catechol 2,3-dioxygenase-like lactoylglutathione lyase family enzyme
VDMKFAVTVLPVADAERAKAFYQGLGWRLDADISVDENYRIVQFTPPGSPASIQFGTGISTLTPGSVRDLLPGRVWPTDVGALAGLLHETADHHGAFEAVAPPHDWWDWYAAYMDARQRGSSRKASSTAAGRYMAGVKHIVV